MKLTRRQWLLAGGAVAAVGVWMKDTTSSGGDIEAMQMYTEKMKSHCVGRFLIDAPSAVTDASGNYGVRIAGVRVLESIPRPAGIVVQLLDARVQKREAELRASPVPSNNAGRLLKSLQPTPQSRLLYFIGPSDRKGSRAEGYVARDGGIFFFDTHAYDDADLKEFSDFLADIEPTLFIRPNDVIPSTPGFCIDNGLITTNPARGENVNGWSWTLPQHPDVTFGMSTISNDDRVDPGIIDREGGILREAASLMAHVKTLRKRRFDLAGMAAQEWLVETTDDRPEYSFQIELPGHPRDNLRPFVSMGLKVGGYGKDGYRKPSLTTGEALALWDAVTRTLRLRVGSA